MLNIDILGTTLEFEHSLVSLSKWEAIHEKPFFAWSDKDTKTKDEMLSYFEQMLISPVDRPQVTVAQLTDEHHVALVEYINAKRTATVVREVQSKPGVKENVTSELIYYWLVAFQIPFHPAETWHLNRLMTLVRVCGAKNSKPEKQAPGALANKYREMNEARRKQLGTAG